MIFNKKQQTIARNIDTDADISKWKNWKWQLKHSVTDIDTFEKISGIKFPADYKKSLQETIDKFPLSVTPYYISLIDPKNYEYDPVFIQSFPSPSELIMSKYDMADPLAEDKDSPVPHLTHRYPDRVLFHVSNTCSMYCRHCTRKRKVGDDNHAAGMDELEPGLKYISEHPEIRDVLISGGDPLMLSDDYLDKLLERISSIEHVEMIRIGTRMPVVLPYRITNKLIEVLKKYQPIYVNTHFNHPREMTKSAEEGLAMLADAGIVLGNQTVLLAGVNDCPRIIKTLCHKLLANRVRPYYLYQCDLSEGLSHFRTPVGKGIEILENLIGHTTGLGVPTYVIDAPGGGGKIPVMPNYLISWSTNKVILRNYEGVITTYKEPDSYEATFCNRKCDECDLQLNLEGAIETSNIGIQMLLSDDDDTISLTPADNDRFDRRDE
ncbi:MAG: lysine 2,3-aminomutase [Spirochaetes bacterium]|jgi:lysine 2,3-aminomutase|nr:lysine 2,3-aminomutase [Spirochaetota bacterium]